MRWRLVKNKVLFAALLGISMLYGVLAIPTAYGASSSTNVTSHVCSASFIAPVITDPASGGKTKASSIVVKGTGEPGLALTIRVGGHPKAAVVVAGDGSFAAQVPLAFGPNTLSAQEKDSCGNTKDSSEVTVERLRAPEPAPSPDENGGTGTPSSPQDSGRSNRYSSGRSPNTSGDSIGSDEKPSTRGGNGAETPKITNLKENEHVDTDHIWVAGTAQPGSVVIIYVNGKEAARVVVGEDGTFGARVALKPGDNTIKAVEERDGKRIAGRTWHVTYTPKAAEQPHDSRWVFWVIMLMVPLLLLLAAWLAYRHYKYEQEEKL